MANLHVSGCHNCNGFALWVGERLVFPLNVQKTPELVEEDFEEAAAILNKSPRGATALMRVCIQKLVPLLKQDGKYLNDYISSLIRKALEVEIQQSMEVLQVLRNDPGQGPTGPAGGSPSSDSSWHPHAHYSLLEAVQSAAQAVVERSPCLVRPGVFPTGAEF